MAVRHNQLIAPQGIRPTSPEVDGVMVGDPAGGWHNQVHRVRRCRAGKDELHGPATIAMTKANPLDALLLRAGKGDVRAFEELYGATSRKLFAAAFFILKDEAIAEEVLQEACIKIWHHAGSFDPQKASALTWMNRVVRNRALDVIRSQKARPEEVAVEWEGPEFAAENPGPMDLADIAVSSEHLSECLKELQEQQRQVILMAYLYGHTHDELSTITGSPLGTIKAWIRRGLERLRQCLD